MTHAFMTVFHRSLKLVLLERVSVKVLKTFLLMQKG